MDSFSKSISKTENLLASFRVQAASAPLFALALGTGRSSGEFLSPLRNKMEKLRRKRTYWHYYADAGFEEEEIQAYSEQLAIQARAYAHLGGDEVQMHLDRMQMNLGDGEISGTGEAEAEEGLVANAVPGEGDLSAGSPSYMGAEASPDDDEDDLRSVATHASHLGDISRPLEPTMLNAQHPTAGMLGQ
jgi:hypothetical protein